MDECRRSVLAKIESDKAVQSGLISGDQNRAIYKMMRVWTKYHSVVLLFLLLTIFGKSYAAGFVSQIELENNFDEDRNRETAIEATIQYRTKHWKTHLEFDKPVYPKTEDGSLEWQYEYRWKGNEQIFFLRHELDYGMDDHRTRAELTPRWYYLFSKETRAGFEVEFDYYDSRADDALELSYVEIEPTIKWAEKRGNAEYSFELEAPKYRLYSSDDDTENVEFIGFEPIFSYARDLARGDTLEFELSLPYDAQDNEFELGINLRWIWGLN